MATPPWVILGRFLRAEKVEKEAYAASVDADALAEHQPKAEDDDVKCVAPVNREEQAQAEDVVAVGLTAEHDAGAAVDSDALALGEHHSAAAEAQEPMAEDGDAEQEESRAEDFVEVGAPAEHAAGAAAAEPDFTVSVTLPPRVTILAAGRGAQPDPGTPDMYPCIVAAAPSLLLVNFVGPPFYGTLSSDHLVLVRDFHTKQGQKMASAERLPYRLGPAPIVGHIESLLLVPCGRDGTNYMIAELQVARDGANAMFIWMRPDDNKSWFVKKVACPLPENRKWTPHGAVSVDDTLWWFDLSWGILSCDTAALPELAFHELPSRQLAEATLNIHTKRWVAASQNKLRYIEIITEGGDSTALVRMWSRSRCDRGGWRWVDEWTMRFRELWDDASYKDAELPRVVPVLAVLCPSDPNLIYFALEHRLFGVNVLAQRLVHIDYYELVDLTGSPRPASGRYIVPWELSSATAQALGIEPEDSQHLGLPLPREHVDSDNVQILQVWKDTSEEAFSRIGAILSSVGSGECLVALDTEFCIPDGVQCLPYEPPTPDQHYSQLLSYVHGGDLVQVGIVIADTEFNLLGGTMFQFNLMFDPTRRSGDHRGVKFLRESGLILEEHARKGLPASEFINKIRESGLLRNKNVTWVTFNGYPDFGFMINLLTKDPLPESRLIFLSQVADYFPLSCDCKFFSKYGECINKERVPGKLEAVARELGAKRTGECHQAASDALLSLRCLQRLKALAPDPKFYEKICGILYGVYGRQYLDL